MVQYLSGDQSRPDFDARYDKEHTRATKSGLGSTALTCPRAWCVLQIGVGETQTPLYGGQSIRILRTSHPCCWLLRWPWCVCACADRSFVSLCLRVQICRGDLDWPRIELDLYRYVESILSPRPSRPTANTFFLSLTLTDLSALGDRAALRAHIDQVTRAADAIEVRVDLLTSEFDEDRVAAYLAQLRSVSRLPIIYTVRSKKQGGAFVDYCGQDAANSEMQMVRQLELGFRLGVQAIDIEADLSVGARARLYSLRSRCYPGVLLIASHHEPRSNGGSSLPALQGLFDRCLQSGAPHVPDLVKVVVFAGTESDAFRLVQAAAEVEQEWAQRVDGGPCIIALAMGPLGRISRVYNRVWTPVTHPALAVTAAPGQLSIAEIMRARESLRVAPFALVPASGRLQWLLFGSPISASPSPLLHNTAFEYLHLSPTFSYAKLDTQSVDAVAAALARPDFGGGNVTIPLKEAVCALLPHCSEAVQRIGAVNTIVRRPDGTLAGENTDWQGIAELIQQRCNMAASMPDAAAAESSRASSSSSSTPSSVPCGVCVVLGAGGTARAAIYAAQQVGFRDSCIVVCNPRTPHKAMQLAERFGVRGIQNINRENIAQATGHTNVRTRKQRGGDRQPMAAHPLTLCVLVCVSSL